MSSADLLAARRRRLLVVNAFAFGTWQVALYGPNLAGKALAPVLITIGLLGFAAWAGSLFLVLRRPADPRTSRVLDDELTRQNAGRSFQFGYWALLLTAACALPLAMFVDLPTTAVLRALVIVGVASPILRFVVLERPDATGD
jgi:ABC-type spermidine/putrescine transport system permease subunit I